MKPSITVGLTATGEHRVLYVGNDAQAAVDALRNAPAEIVEAEVYRKPVRYKRLVREQIQNEPAAPEAPAQSGASAQADTFGADLSQTTGCAPYLTAQDPAPEPPAPAAAQKKAAKGAKKSS